MQEATECSNKMQFFRQFFHFSTNYQFLVTFVTRFGENQKNTANYLDIKKNNGYI